NPGFAVTLKVTDPGPVPDDAVMILIQFTLLVADHVQPLGPVNETKPVVAPEFRNRLDGLSAKLQATASCFTGIGFPPTVTVAVRCVDALFAATVNVTVVEPAPVLFTSVTQSASAVAIQWQSDDAVTWTVNVPPPPPTEIGPCEMFAEQRLNNI